jgi:AcrR family transcriptional regulator
MPEQPPRTSFRARPTGATKRGGRATKPPTESAQVAHEERLVELARWIDEGRLPEVVPTRQERSLRTTLAMLDAGHALLMKGTLEDLSIEQVCQQAGTAVGAFYGRFATKQAFFVAIQRVVSLRSEADLASFIRRHEGNDTTLEEVCLDVASYVVNVFRINLGVLRASLQHTREGMYDVHQTAGDRNRPVFAQQLAPRLKHLPARVRRLRVDFAYLAMVGTLVHTILNDTGPLSLHDDGMTEELARQMRAYLEEGAS